MACHDGLEKADDGCPVNNQVDTKLWSDFFALETVGELKTLFKRLDISIPEQAAISYYISTWPDFIHGKDDETFCPGNFVSRDRSAVMFGKMPVIFEGTNNWSWKAYYPAEDLIAKTESLKNSISVLRELNPVAKMSLLLIPEKDYLISRFFLKEDRFSALNSAIASLQTWLEKLDIALIYEKPFHRIDKFQTASDFEYMDSHLPGRNYVSMFGTYLADLGMPWTDIRQSITLKNMPQFGDLATKFAEGIPAAVPMLQPDVPQSTVTQISGNETFADPLGDTWQDFSNDEPLVDQSICLLGDSHCSIYEQRKITYLSANTFRETHFEWNPCGIRKKTDIASYDNVLLEISSRFTV